MPSDEQFQFVEDLHAKLNKRELKIIVNNETKIKRLKVICCNNLVFDKFSDEFNQNIRIEIQGVVEWSATDFNFDWDGIDSSRQFKSWMQQWKKWAAANVDKIVVDEREFPCVCKALWLIGLIQVSSCAVETVFSALQRIRELCGDRMLEDMLAVRTHATFNGIINCLPLRAYEHPLEDVW